MALAPLDKVETTLGQFALAKNRNVYFDYGPATDRPFGDEYSCAVWVGDGTFRYAKVLRTIAYVVVDEAADGSPVTERWEICKHKEYTR